MPKKPKYKNYAALSAAFKSGELSRHYSIRLDKGGASASLTFYNPSLSDEENESKSEECEALFSPEYYAHIFDLYKAIGIHAEWR